MVSDDIVTRLRNESVINQALHIFDDEGDISAEAADEIEDLRAELEEFKRQYQILKKEVNVWRGICERFAESDPRFDAFRIYFMAVRGE